MATFTTFAFGTGENSTMEKKNIISQFLEACSSAHGVIEGPDALGFKVISNATTHTEQIINWLQTQNQPQNTLNFVGFSRGAVTLFHVVNRLKKIELALLKSEPTLNPDKKVLLQRLQALNINIFAIDPVAGLTAKGEQEARRIPSNVKNYVGILQQHEMRRDFKPQDITRLIVASPKTKVSMLPFYGNHSATSKIKGVRMQTGAQLCWYALHHYLSLHGTEFHGNEIPQLVSSQMTFSTLPPNPTGKQLLQLFTTHHQERRDYIAAGKVMTVLDSLPILRKDRTLNKHLNFYVKSAFFVNQLERELFKLSYPITFNYLFEQNLPDEFFPSQSPKSAVLAELTQLRQENSTLFSRLARLNVKVDHETDMIHMGEPGGVYVVDTCETLKQLFPHLLIKQIKTSRPDLSPDVLTSYLASEDPLTTLEKAIHGLTFRYEREKKEFYIFSARGESPRAHLIRAQVQTLIDHTDGDRQTKYQAVLNMLESHFLDMTKAGNCSALRRMLGGLLAAYNRQYLAETPIIREILAALVHHSFNLVKETISFIGTFGYVGGGVLSLVGIIINDFGKRMNDVVGSLGLNPFKYLVSAIGYLLEGLGLAIKNSLGLKPLTQFIATGINTIRDAANIALRGTEVHHLPSNQPLQGYGLNPKLARHFVSELVDNQADNQEACQTLETCCLV